MIVLNCPMFSQKYDLSYTLKTLNSLHCIVLLTIFCDDRPKEGLLSFCAAIQLLSWQSSLAGAQSRKDKMLVIVMRWPTSSGGQVLWPAASG